MLWASGFCWNEAKDSEVQRRWKVYDDFVELTITSSKAHGWLQNSEVKAICV